MRTLAFGRPPDAETVVIGSGKDGLPIILGNVDVLPQLPTAARLAGGKPPPAAAPGASENAPARPSPNVGGTSGARQSMRGELGDGVDGRGRPARDGAEAGPAAAGKGPIGAAQIRTRLLPGIVGSALSRIYGVVVRLSRGRRRRRERGHKPLV